MTCAIEINNLNFSYDEFSLVDVNMSLHLGEQKALVGLNGSGKTTLFKLILGLLEPTSGSIHVFERKVERENYWTIRKDVGFLFQSPDDQLFAPTVWEDVAFGPRNLGMTEQEVELQVQWALEKVGMSSFTNRPVNQMSHGQAKRVALAGIIAICWMNHLPGLISQWCPTWLILYKISEMMGLVFYILLIIDSFLKTGLTLLQFFMKVI